MDDDTTPPLNEKERLRKLQKIFASMADDASAAAKPSDDDASDSHSTDSSTMRIFSEDADAGEEGEGEGEEEARGAAASSGAEPHAFAERMLDTLRAMVAREVALQLDSRMAALEGLGGIKNSLGGSRASTAPPLVPAAPAPAPSSSAAPASAPAPAAPSSSSVLPAPTFAQLADLERALLAERARNAALRAQLPVETLPPSPPRRLRPPTLPPARAPTAVAAVSSRALKGAPQTETAAALFASSLFEQAPPLFPPPPPPPPRSWHVGAGAGAGAGPATALREQQQQQQQPKLRRRDLSGMGAGGAVLSASSRKASAKPRAGAEQ